MTKFLPWTPENVAELRRLVGDSRSGSQIARDLTRFTGYEITRNMVIGKVKRLGLHLAGDKSEARPREQKPRRPKRQPTIHFLSRAVRKPHETRPPMDVDQHLKAAMAKSTQHESNEPAKPVHFLERT